MTLTSLLPTLRESLPTPLDPDVWPARSQATTTDVVIAGVSVLRIVELCATPCVHTDAAVVPFSRGAASPAASTTVVVAAVTVADPGGVELDATFDHHDAVWREARLLGRVSHARDAAVSVRNPGDRTLVGTAVLPADLCTGDLVAVPCPGCFSVGDVRPRAAVTRMLLATLVSARRCALMAATVAAADAPPVSSHGSSGGASHPSPPPAAPRG